MKTFIRWLYRRSERIDNAMTLAAPKDLTRETLDALPFKAKLHLAGLFLRMAPYALLIFVICTIRPKLWAELDSP